MFSKNFLTLFQADSSTSADSNPMRQQRTMTSQNSQGNSFTDTIPTQNCHIQTYLNAVGIWIAYIWILETSEEHDLFVSIQMSDRCYDNEVPDIEVPDIEVPWHWGPGPFIFNFPVQHIHQSLGDFRLAEV